jgi:hypothetical protein
MKKKRVNKPHSPSPDYPKGQRDRTEKGKSSTKRQERKAQKVRWCLIFTILPKRAIKAQ